VPEHAVLKFNICTKEVIQLTTDTEHNWVFFEELFWLLTTNPQLPCKLWCNQKLLI
jgi:hypothetical protein